MADNETMDVLEIQRMIVNAEKAKQLARQRQLQRDIRPMIAKSGQYNPDADVPYEYQRYPLLVKVGDKEIKVYSEAEEKYALGIKVEPAKKVDVDITNLVQPTEVHVKRKYTKKDVPVALPADLK